jgi:cytochrome P450
MTMLHLAVQEQIEEQVVQEETAPSGSSRAESQPRPAAPRPHTERMGLFATIRALRTNPITAFPEEAYQVPILEVGRLRKLVLVNDPDEIEHVLVGNAGNYRKSMQQQRRLQPALGDGLLTAEGAAWQGARRIAAPLFNPGAVAQLSDDMLEAAAVMRDRWLDRFSPARPMDLSAEFQRLTYEIVSRTVFSGALDQDRARVHANMAIYFDTFGRIDLASLFNLPAWVPTQAALRARPALAVFRSIVDRIVAQRVADPEREASDLLDRLMRSPVPATGKVMTPVAVADNVLTFLAAGHETTGNALAWILYLLALFPDTESKVTDELLSVVGDRPESVDAFDKLVFTRAVVNEALRLYPPAPFMGREALDGDDLAGRRIEKGTQVLISPWIVHRHRRLWDDPDGFHPERFMPPNDRDIPRGAFIPFGLGPRICIGRGFAIQEILAVLATILPVFHFRLLDPQSVVPQARITLRPAGGMPMIVTPR